MCWRHVRCLLLPVAVAQWVCLAALAASTAAMWGIGCRWWGCSHEHHALLELAHLLLELLVLYSHVGNLGAQITVGGG